MEGDLIGRKIALLKMLNAIAVEGWDIIVHYSSCCLSKTQIGEIMDGEWTDTEERYELVDSLFMDAVTSKAINAQWTIKLKLNNTTIEFKIDTGAAVNAISEEAYHKIGALAFTP